jgi:hypothetical protein
VSLALALALWVGAPAIADQPDVTHLLPPNGTSAAQLPIGFEVCRDGSTRCPDEAVAEMYRRWRPLNNRCDHKAVFALTYLRTTEEFVRTVKADPSFFSDNPWINWEDRVFAQLYFNPADAWRNGHPVPPAWKIAFQTTESPDVTAIGDLFLGMNAHIQRDLPFVLAHVGLVKPNGESRKADHDKVNQFLDHVATKLQKELSERYDELFVATSAAGPVDEPTVLQGVRGWRELAWRNAERLVNAATDADRAAVAQSIDSYAESQARLILAGNTMPGYGPTRDAYCRAHNALAFEPQTGAGVASRGALSLSLRLYRRSIRRALRVGSLRARVTMGEGGSVTLVATGRSLTPTARSAAATSFARAAGHFARRGSRTLDVSLSAAGRRMLRSALRRGRRVRISVSARAFGVDGEAAQRTASITLRR